MNNNWVALGNRYVGGLLKPDTTWPLQHLKKIVASYCARSRFETEFNILQVAKHRDKEEKREWCSPNLVIEEAHRVLAANLALAVERLGNRRCATR